MISSPGDHCPSAVDVTLPAGVVSTTADGIMALIRDLNERRGLTVVIVTHDPGVSQRTYRIVRMRDDLIVGQMTLSTRAEVREPALA